MEFKICQELTALLAHVLESNPITQEQGSVGDGDPLERCSVDG
jgi:hypothetical protein